MVRQCNRMLRPVLVCYHFNDSQLGENKTNKTKQTKQTLHYDCFCGWSTVVTQQYTFARIRILDPLLATVTHNFRVFFFETDMLRHSERAT